MSADLGNGSGSSGYGLPLQNSNFMDQTSSPYPSGLASQPAHIGSQRNTLPPSPHYGNLSSSTDISSLLGANSGHLSHHLGLNGHSLQNGSPSSPTATEDYFMMELQAPQRIKKKGRKPKQLDVTGQPQQTNKRKSREGLLCRKC